MLGCLDLRRVFLVQIPQASNVRVAESALSSKLIFASSATI